MKKAAKVFVSLFMVITILIGNLQYKDTTAYAASAADVVRIAAGEVGVSGKPNKYTYWNGAIGGSYSYAWCHAFVSWCASQAGAGNLVPKTASCYVGAQWFKNQGLWKSRGSGYVPKAGDIIYFDWNANGGWDHVGIVEDARGGKVYIIDGNSGGGSGAVKRHSYSLSDAQILGYGTPAYKKEQDLNIEMRCWFSNTGMGNAISECKTGDDLYLCYELYDAATGKRWNELESRSYQVKEIVYNPDGSEHYSDRYDNSDNNWIKINPDADGTYRGRIELTGDRTGSVECTINAKSLNIKMRCWFSNTGMGNAISECKTGDDLYLCYELYDGATGKRWNELESRSYQVKEIVYNPDGSEHYSDRYDNSDYNWIKINPNADGTYRGRIELTGDRTGSVECTINAKSLNIMARCWFSKEKMGDKISKIYSDDGMIYLCYEIIDGETKKPWNKVESASYSVKETIYRPDGSECGSRSHERSDYNCVEVRVDASGAYRGKVEITGARNGTLEADIQVKDRKKFTIAYNANGGNSYPAPQAKMEGKAYTIAGSAGKRQRILEISANGGHFGNGKNKLTNVYMENFVKWNTKADGSGTDYAAGSNYELDVGLTLYAQYECRKLGDVAEPTRENYEFTGWNTKADGTGSWLAKDSLVTADMTVYAQWKKAEAPAQTPTPTSTPTTEPPSAAPTKAPTAPPSSMPTKTQGQVIVSKESGVAGSVIPVTVSLKNNPGIASMTLNVEYDRSALTLKSVQDKGLLSGASFTGSATTNANPYRMIWSVETSNAKADGILATLMFEVKEGAKNGEYPIRVSFEENDIYDTDLETVGFTVVDGAVRVSDSMPGDVNRDICVNTKDATLITQHYAGWDVEIDEEAADVNEDKKVNTKDAALILQKYTGWDVELK